MLALAVRLEEQVMASPFVVTPDTAPRPLNVVGEALTVLASTDQTGGYEVFLQNGGAGSGPPPHRHPWDESFYVVSGELTFGYGEEQVTVGPGSFVHLPGGTMHWFRFGPDGGQAVSMTSRGNAAKMFTEFDREIAPAAPDVGKLVAIARSHGADIPPPPAR
jgi:quercetin dioxygenase-like cupin family protein